MTVLEIVNLLKLQADDKKIITSDVIYWLNECQLVDLGPDAYIEANTTITASANEWVNMPSDFLKVRYIELNGVKYTGVYEERARQVKFPVSGIYTIYYSRLASTITSENETPEAHPLLHYPMVHYCRARQLDKEGGPNAEDAIMAMNEYIRLRDNVLTNIRRSGTSGSSVQVIR